MQLRTNISISLNYSTIFFINKISSWNGTQQNDLLVRVDSCAAWYSGFKIAGPDTTAGSKLHFSVQVKGTNGGGAVVDGSMPVECM